MFYGADSSRAGRAAETDTKTPEENTAAAQQKFCPKFGYIYLFSLPICRMKKIPFFIAYGETMSAIHTQNLPNRPSEQTENAKQCGRAHITRSQTTMDAIKSYIISNGLKPGDPLPTEAKLCGHIGVSRSSVREALRRLEALDIVSARQGSGSFVGNMSLRPLVDTLILRTSLDAGRGIGSLRDVIAVRKIIDLGLGDELTSRMKGTYDGEMHFLVAKMREKAERAESFFTEDLAFHKALYAHLDNNLIRQLLSAMWLIHRTLIPRLGQEETAESMKAAAKAHKMILQAAEKGNPEEYRRAITLHYAPLEKLVTTHRAHAEK